MTTLSEADSKRVLEAFGVVTGRERVVSDASAAGAAADTLGYPVVVKLVGATIAHKTERGLVRLGLTDRHAVEDAASELLDQVTRDDGDVEVLVAEHVKGHRELIAGMVRDPQFGATVMLGVGGIFAEAIADVVFRPAPIDVTIAEEMLESLSTQRLLGEFRGERAVSRKHLVELLLGLGRLASERPDVASVDLNPLIVSPDGIPVAVDALIELRQESVTPADSVTSMQPVGCSHDDEAFMALFEPNGIVVTGVSAHPGKYGFVALHNILASGYQGHVFGTNLSEETVLGMPTVSDIDQLPDGAIDLAVICTPREANPAILRACARKGVRAVFVASAGYGESDADGKRAERELIDVADELGILLAGPNGQGLVSTPASLCAQIVAPYPPAGRIGVASQSGNFVSSFLNTARATGVGISRAVSAGNAATVGVADYLRFFAHDPATAVGLAYLEGISDGERMMRELGEAASVMPIVLLKGGSTEGGAAAAASHTGALAADDKLFDGACRAYGLTRTASVEEAFEAAATFASQPLPAGPNVVVLTTAGGWGVVTADSISRQRELNLLTLPQHLLTAIDRLLPPRWSRSNPVDCAGGETRDTIPEVLELIAEHPDVHAIVYIGLGIQSNQARLIREGKFYPQHGLERIVEYHERQDRRFAETSIELSARTGKPILCATDLATTDPANPGVAAVRAGGRLVYPSGERAVTALAHLHRYARHQRRRGR